MTTADQPSQVMRLLVAVRYGVVIVWRWLKKPFKFLDTHNGAVTAVATVIIAVLTVAYVWYSKRQWQVAQDTLRVSQRAYVTIGRKDGTVAEFISPKDPRQKAELIIYFQNSGHLPAKLAWGSGAELNLAMLGANKPTGITYIHPFHFMERTRDNKTQTNAETGVDAIVAGESVFQGVIGEITTEQLAEFAASNTDILIVGTYQYCDEIGTESMHTFEIHSRNALNSVLNFSVVGDTETPWLPYGKKAEIESFSACKPFDDIDPNRQGQKGLIR